MATMESVMYTQKAWSRYINALSKIDMAARKEMVRRYGIILTDSSEEAIAEMVRYAYTISAKYGEAAATLACELYDEMAIASGLALMPAEPAAVASIGEVSAALRSTTEITKNMDAIGSVVGRLSKRPAADTTLKNAKRDRAEVAWVSRGDTCAFCIALASRGWESASSVSMPGGHAAHFHANCDCMYAVRFNSRTNVEGYSPEEYKEMYYAAPLDGDAPTSKNRINALRRAQYRMNADKINAQKRAAYALQKEAEEEAEDE